MRLRFYPTLAGYSVLIPEQIGRFYLQWKPLDVHREWPQLWNKRARILYGGVNIPDPYCGGDGKVTMAQMIEWIWGMANTHLTKNGIYSTSHLPNNA